MKTQKFISKTASLLVLAGFSLPLVPRAYSANGLLESLFGRGRTVDIPIETVSGGGGLVSYAQIREQDGRYIISGSVKRKMASNPGPNSHVDIFIMNAKQETLRSFAVNYMPRPIPYGVRGIPARSTFSASLDTLPPEGASIKVAFHDAFRKCGI